MDLQNKTINFLGDSITFGFGVNNLVNCFVNILKHDCYLKNARNYGECATRIAYQKIPSDDPLIDRNFIMRTSEMDKDADIIVIFGGTNDFGHGDAPLDTGDNKDVYSFTGACHVLFQKIIERYPKALIVVVTPLHRIDEDNVFGDKPKEKPGGTLEEYVDIILKVAGYYALPVLDLYHISGLQPKIPIIKELYFFDGLHPNDNGHRIIANKIKKYLEAQ